MHSCPESGSSLIEVLIAMALVLVVAASVAPLMLLGIQVSDHSQDNTDLLLTASEHMEHLRALPYTDAALVAGGSLTSSATGYALDPLPANPDHYVRWEVTDISVHLKQIALVAGSRAPLLGGANEVRLETFRTDLR